MSDKLWNGDLDSHLKGNYTMPTSPKTKETHIELAQRLSESLGLTCHVHPSESRLTKLTLTIPKEHDILTAIMYPKREATTVAHMMSIIEDVCCALGIRPFYVDKIDEPRSTMKLRVANGQEQYFMPHEEVTDEMHYTMFYEGSHAKAVQMSTRTKEDGAEKACVSFLLCHHNVSVKYRVMIDLILTRYGKYAIEAMMTFIPVENYSNKIVDQRKDRYSITVEIEQDK